MTEEKKQRGFTLAEVVVVLALLGILIVAFLTMYTGFNKLLSLHQAITTVQEQGSQAAYEFNLYGLQATAVLASQTISSTNYTSGAQTAIFQVPSIDSSGNIIANTYDYIVFNLNGSSLSEIISPGSGSIRPNTTKLLLSNSVNSLTFTYDNASFPSVSKVTMDLVNQNTVSTQSASMHITQAVYLRNH